jgi:tetratricopeptide (TPR) repeat protein
VPVARASPDLFITVDLKDKNQRRAAGRSRARGLHYQTVVMSLCLNLLGRGGSALRGTLAIAILMLVVAASRGDAHADEDQRDPTKKPLPPEEARRIEGLRADANATLARGEFERARKKFEEVLKTLPGDAPAQRDAARAAQAAGEFEYAAAALERAHHFEEHTPDPEIHYLRGEALYVLDRDDEANREHRIAELEIGKDPKERMPKLWLARIYARRGYIVLADRIYDTMWPPAPKVDVEVAINQADAHLMHEDWNGGERVLKRFLEREPKNIRAREMLAWALEAKGDLDGELAVRKSLAEDDPTPINKRDYGRALERAADYRAAHSEYSKARALGAKDPDGTLVASIERMRYRTTPEVAGGLMGRSDPQASSWRAQAGVAMPFGRRHNLSLMGWRDQSRSGLWGNTPSVFDHGTGSVTGLGSSVLLAARSGPSLVVGGDVRYSTAAVETTGFVQSSRQLLKMGAMAEIDVPFPQYVQINIRGDLNSQWTEAPVTIQEGGAASGATGHLYLFPKDRRFLLDVGAQIRRLSLTRLDEPEDTADPRASQALLFIGGDAVLWSNPTRQMRGEAMDERLVRRNYLSDAGIMSYRHYQLFSASHWTFNDRIELAPRAAIHIGGLNIRKAFARSRAGIDLRGGLGYDTSRERVISQGGVSLMVAPSWSSRIALTYDVSRETATGLTGVLQTGWLTYHADL